MIGDIIGSFLQQMLLSVGVIVLFGLLIALCRRAFCHVVGSDSSKIVIATGIIGTPIHELSHALACLLFGHRITEMKLYAPNSEEGTLGYVSHTYNPKNLYHQVGNFFIGVAPILGGSAVLYLLMALLVPDVFRDVTGELEFAGFITVDPLAPSTYGDFFALFVAVLREILWFGNFTDWRFWIFLVLALAVAIHMEVSTADIKGGARGFAYIAVLCLAVDLLLGLVFPSALEAFTGFLLSAAAYIAGFLGISAVFSGVLVLAALAVKNGTKLIKK